MAKNLLLKEAKAARKFPDNTCSYSRHAFDIGEALLLGKPYSMLTDEPDHCGASIVGTVVNLWEARTEIARLKKELEEWEGKQ